MCSYLINRGRNRCSHRDYQNIAVNGARAGAMNNTIQRSLSRNREADAPVVLTYALIGNDVRTSMCAAQFAARSRRL